VYNTHVRLQGKTHCVEYFFHQLSITKHIIVTGKKCNVMKQGKMHLALCSTEYGVPCIYVFCVGLRIISLYSINRLVFVTEVECVYCIRILHMT